MNIFSFKVNLHLHFKTQDIGHFFLNKMSSCNPSSTTVPMSIVHHYYGTITMVKTPAEAAKYIQINSIHCCILYSDRQLHLATKYCTTVVFPFSVYEILSC